LAKATKPAWSWKAFVSAVTPVKSVGLPTTMAGAESIFPTQSL
jgi:hypothetical protein